MAASQNGIGAEGAKQLAECLRDNTALTSLALWNNGIGAEGATQLAECLRINTALTSLDLRNNAIGDACKRALPAACPRRCTLTF